MRVWSRGLGVRACRRDGARYAHRDVFRERVPGMCTKDCGRSLPSGAGAGMCRSLLHEILARNFVFLR